MHHPSNLEHLLKLNNLQVGSLIIDRLVQLGANEFVISPGSRSTPLTIAAARHPQARTTVHYDERGAAYFALGIGRATGLPAVLICTSGTAVANYYPAVIEASMDNIPMVVLSADRPPELIDVGANQAIFQDQIYGVYPRLSMMLSPPDVETTPTHLLNLADDIFRASLEHRPGPVHLNCQFREPLLPEDGASHLPKLPAQPPPQLSPIKIADEAVKQLKQKVEASTRILIIAGRSLRAKDGIEILKLARSLEAPLFPDVQSTLKFVKDAHVINHFDLTLLRDEVKNLKPEVVLHFGGPYTSKRLLSFMNDPQIEYIAIRPTPERIDPNHQVSMSILSEVDQFCQAFNSRPSHQDTAFLKKWQEEENIAWMNTLELITPHSDLSEPAVSHSLSRNIPDGHALLLANSMSIREMEMFGEEGHFHGKVYANRGSSGIDGLLATATGISYGGDQPVTMLIGDLAFLHDLSSLAFIRSASHPVVLVVINNNGGGIFEFLPVKHEDDVFETFFGTPHHLHLDSAAKMFELEYACPDDMEAFVRSYSTAIKKSRSTLIEVRTDRSLNYQYHQTIYEGISESG